MAQENLNISSNPNVLDGKPCITGTRIAVAQVLRHLSVCEDPQEELGITEQDVADCLQYAARLCDVPSQEKGGS